MKSNEIRFYIQIRFKLGIELKDILNELKIAISDHAPSLKTIYNWISAFKKSKSKSKNPQLKISPVQEDQLPQSLHKTSL